MENVLWVVIWVHFVFVFGQINLSQLLANWDDYLQFLYFYGTISSLTFNWRVHCSKMIEDILSKNTANIKSFTYICNFNNQIYKGLNIFTQFHDIFCFQCTGKCYYDRTWLFKYFMVFEFYQKVHLMELNTILNNKLIFIISFTFNSHNEQINEQHSTSTNIELLANRKVLQTDRNYSFNRQNPSHNYSTIPHKWIRLNDFDTGKRLHSTNK